jgi:hypothetical protein
MRAVPSSLRLLSSFLFVLFLASSIHAQMPGVNNQTAAPTPGSGHDYIHMLNETVNPANGSVSIHIQVPVPKSRGLTLPFAIQYDSGGVWTPSVVPGQNVRRNRSNAHVARPQRQYHALRLRR